MAQFYAEIQGNRGEATRMGSKESGIRGHIRGWHVGASVRCHNTEDTDYVSVEATHGSNGYGQTKHVATFREVGGAVQVVLFDAGGNIVADYLI